jgi:hypothetical protein
MVSLKHGTQVTGANNPSKQVSVTVWNQEHTLTGTAGSTIVFDPTTGAAIERKLPRSLSDYGATGTSDNASTAAASLRDYIASQAHDLAGLTEPMSLASGRIPPGCFRILTSEALLSSTYLTKRNGYKLLGEGSGLTQIVFDPQDGGSRALLYNKAYQDLEIGGMQVVSDSASNTFMKQLANNAASLNPQRVLISDIAFSGAWGDIFALDGDGNNSEWTFNRVSVNGTGVTTASTSMSSFLHTLSTGSDQFVNYWFQSCPIWPTATGVASNFLKIEKGGAFHIDHCDFSGWQNGTIFNVTGTNPFGSMSITSSRFELKSANVKAMTMKWTGGFVSWRDCDLGVNAFIVASSTVTFEFDCNPGPSILFDNCVLVGTHKFNQMTSESRRYTQSIEYRNCWFLQFNDIFDAFTFTSSGQSGGLPQVRLKGCMGTATPITSSLWAINTAYALNAMVRCGLGEYKCTTAGTSAAAGLGPRTKAASIADNTAVWQWVRNEPRCYITDTVINWHKTPAAKGVKHHVALFAQSDMGWPSVAEGPLDIILPPNVLVTSVKLYLAVGASASASFPTYKIETDDGTKTFIDNSASVTAASAGVDLSWTGSYAVGSGIQTRCIRLTPSGVVPVITGGYAVVEYYG